MKYWDSSAVVAVLIQEAPSARMLSFLEQDAEILTWWGTEVECVSAIARLEREEMLSRQAVSIALKRLSELSRSWNEIRPGHKLREIAKRLLRVHNLRAADALQLAAALISVDDPASLEVVCLDERLCRATEREGFILLPAPDAQDARPPA